MNKSGKLIRPGWVAVLALALSSCIRDGYEDCYSYLRFRFDYNVLKADAFHKQAEQVDVYFFDADGGLIRKLSETVPSGLQDNTFHIQLPEGLDDVATIVAWAGLDDRQYNIPDTNSIDELIVSIRETEGSDVEHDYAPLLWGRLELPEGISYLNEINTVEMRKNTNTIRVVLAGDVLLGYDFSPNIDEFEISFTTINGSYGSKNEGVQDRQWTYVPFYTSNEEVSESPVMGKAAVAEIGTHRLIESNPMTLNIVHKPTQTYIIKDMNLNYYLQLLRIERYKKYGFQEYLDREDNYGLVILLGEKTPPVGEGSYFSTRIMLNSWIIREQPVGQ